MNESNNASNEANDSVTVYCAIAKCALSEAILHVCKCYVVLLLICCA